MIGQAELQFMLERAHDLVYELLCSSALVESAQEPAYRSLYHYLEHLAENVTDVTEKEFNVLQKHLWDGVAALKTMTGPKSALGGLVTKGYDRLSQYFTQHVPVASVMDPKLASIDQELRSIRDGLKRLRNDYLFVHLAAKQVYRDILLIHVYIYKKFIDGDKNDIFHCFQYLID
jgi:hypothetical protein